jgi:hypothetical protein
MTRGAGSGRLSQNRTPPATTNAAAGLAHFDHARRFGAAASGKDGDDAWSAKPRSAADWNLRSRSFSRHRRTIRPSAGGTEAGNSGGSSFRMAFILRGDLDGFTRGQRSTFDETVERLARNQFGCDPVGAVVAADVVNGDDVGVIEGAGRARFALETGDAIRVARHARWQHLDGHVSLQARIASPPDLAHAPAAKEFHNLEVAQLRPCTQSFDRRDRRAFQKRIGLLIEPRRCVPVVVIDGKERFRGRVDERLLRRLLAAGREP